MSQIPPESESSKENPPKKDSLRSLQGSKIYLHGSPKVGKTTLANSFPRPLFLATEPGHRFIDPKRVVKLDQGPGGWAKYKKLFSNKDVLDTLAKRKTIVVDTIDSLYHTCFEWTCDDQKFEHPGDEGYGKGWAAIKLEFRRGLSSLIDFCEQHEITLIFISHTKEVEITTTSKYTKMMSTLAGQARDVTMPIPDYIWMMAFKGQEGNTLKHTDDKRLLICQGSREIEAGDREDLLPRVIELNKSLLYKQIEEEYVKSQG